MFFLSGFFFVISLLIMIALFVYICSILLIAYLPIPVATNVSRGEIFLSSKPGRCVLMAGP